MLILAVESPISDERIRAIKFKNKLKQRQHNPTFKPCLQIWTTYFSQLNIKVHRVRVEHFFVFHITKHKNKYRENKM